MQLNKRQARAVNTIARYLGIPDPTSPGQADPSDKEAYEALAQLADDTPATSGITGGVVRRHMERVTVA